MNPDAFKKLDWINLAVTAVAAGVGFAAFSPAVGLGFLAGAGLMALNLFVLRRLTGFILTGTPKKVGVAVFLLVVKLGLFFTAVWLAMTYLPMNALAFGVGAGLIILAVTLTASLARTGSVDAS
jgi:hypothetical protein